MFLFYNQKVFVIFLIEILLILSENGSLLLTSRKLIVKANGTSSASKPFLQIEKRTKSRLTITKPHIPHFLQCNATSDGRYIYQYKHTWYRNDIEQDSFPLRRNDFHIYRNGTLRLPTNERASGIYRCKINANSTAVLSESITVQFPVLKRLPASANLTASSGSSFTLNCPILSVPAANISWYFGNVSLTKNFKENRFLILRNGSLVIRKIFPEDSGKYKCFAQNIFALKEHRQFVLSLSVVQKAKEISSSNTQLIPYLQNQTQYIPQGDAIHLQCHGQNEAITIEWWYQRNLTAKSIKLSNNSEEVYVKHAIIQEHEGFYICKTKTQSQIFHIIVTEPPSIIDEFPSYEGRITAPYVFNCRSIGHPRPSLFWYHNGIPLNSSYSRYINGNDLIIHSFDPEENGIYQCFARNIAGETYTAGELSYHINDEDDFKENPLRNIKCYAHSFNTINVTFESTIAEVSEALFIVYIIQNKPHRWTSPFAPMKLSHHTYAVISSNLPDYRPFKLITRVLFPSQQFGPGGYQNQQQLIKSSLRSYPVTCCTQGLLLHLVHLGNDTFVTWSQPDLNNKKYFILQFSINYTDPHPEQLLTQPLKGTMENMELTVEDVTQKLRPIEKLREDWSRDILHRAESKVSSNDVRSEHLEGDEDIFNIVVLANVSGILLTNFSRVKLRVLLITSENENLRQDFRYVQWKIIQNDTSELSNMPFHLTTIESRLLVFHFLENFNETCIYICKLLIQFPIIRKEEPKCEKRNILSPEMVINNLKPSARYRLHFSSCETHIFYGQMDVETLADPPGTISNQKVIRDNGLKLVWDPPLQNNGKVHHYNILWSLGNVTHERNVLVCKKCFYKFPNVSETDKINISVRVVGDTGVGAPIYIDLRTISHHSLEIEQSSPNDEIYSGIAIGSLLSTFCVFFFIFLVIIQRKRFKSRQQGPVHLSTPTDINFGNLSSTTMPCDSAGGLSGSTLQQDSHEMQTLIPKSRRNIVLLAETRLDQQILSHSNGNGNLTASNKMKNKNQDHLGSGNNLGNNLTVRSGLNLSQLPLCASTPERETKPPFFIAFNKHQNQHQHQLQHQHELDHEEITIQTTLSTAQVQQFAPNAIIAVPSNFSSSPSVHYLSNGNGANDILTPPNSIALKIPSVNLNQNNSNSLTLAMVRTMAAQSSNNSAHVQAQAQAHCQRRGSLTSTSSTSNSCGSGIKKPPTSFHTNFKHSTSIDGICLLAEEESAATLTPTTDLDITKASLTNGFNSSNHSHSSHSSSVSATPSALGSASASNSTSSNSTFGSSSNKTKQKNSDVKASSLFHSSGNTTTTKTLLETNQKHLPRAFQSQNLTKVPANRKPQAMQESFEFWPSRPSRTPASSSSSPAPTITAALSPSPSSSQATSTTAPTTSSSAAKTNPTNFNNKLHRRPNVDPNG